ncbi:MAG: hypothetical protein H3C64_02190 [Candidatus Kuenenia stuttgartiensis]|nr:hypothetical protein [Candidatus Kuenenia stuttgartiensis]
MKKFRFVLLALAVAAVSFAFTPSLVSPKGPTAMVYAFTPEGVYLGSASDVTALKNTLCPGADRVKCAQVWTSKTIDDLPAGTQLPDIKKP